MVVLLEDGQALPKGAGMKRMAPVTAVVLLLLMSVFAVQAGAGAVAASSSPAVVKTAST